MLQKNKSKIKKQDQQLIRYFNMRIKAISINKK